VAYEAARARPRKTSTHGSHPRTSLLQQLAQQRALAAARLQQSSSPDAMDCSHESEALQQYLRCLLAGLLGRASLAPHDCSLELPPTHGSALASTCSASNHNRGQLAG
jgi:hypothetical protein